MEITSFMLVPYEFTIYNFNLAGFNAYVNEKLKKTIINDIIDLSDLTEYVLSEYSHAHIELFLLILDHLFDNDLIEKFSDDLIKKKIDEDTNLLMEEFIQETIDFYMNDINKIGTEPKDIYNIYIDGGFVISEESESIRDKILFTYSDFFIIDFKDEKNRMFSDLSHGEKAIYGLIVNLLYNIKNAGYNDFIFCLDEPDLSLHPEWQRKFLHELITSIKQENKDVHLISTTHSPFLLSDLPKHNILFLDKDDDGKCKVVDGLHEKKQTFGANIHTLLSDSFFMENGLIGDIAKEKIDKTISILNKNKYSEDELEYCENIISIIGEPIIKNQLQKLLDSKRLQKVDEIDTIKTDIEKLKQRLKELENDKN